MPAFRTLVPPALLALAAIGACRTQPPTDGAPPAGSVATPGRPLVGATWSLVALDGTAPPRGAGDRPATVVFEAAGGGAAARAGGFAGCNRWGSSYTLGAPDRLTFEAPFSTKMACVDAGMELERRFLALVSGTRTHRIVGDTLWLRGDGVAGTLVAGPLVAR